MNEATAFLDVAAKFFSALVPLVWIALIVGAFYYFKEDLTQLLRVFKSRMIHGGGLKIGGFEVAEIKIRRLADHDQVVAGGGIVISTDGYEDFENPRQEIYRSSREIMLVHALRRSSSDNQLYDILVYVVPHKEAFINNVVSVTYCFGRYFGHRTFTSRDKARNFAVATSAYGQMLCMAKIQFADGHVAEQYRYIDFEMGDGARETPEVLIDQRKP